MARAIFSLLIIAFLLVSYTISAAYAETYVFDGSGRSQARITQTTTIHVTGLNSSLIANGSKIIYNASYPSSYSVNGYSVSSSNVKIEATPAAVKSNVMTDEYGNPYVQLTWDINKGTPSSYDIVVTTSFNADIRSDLSPVSYEDTIGTAMYPDYQEPTDLVQSDASAIVDKKNELLSGVTSEAEAVDKIVTFVRTTIPTQDAYQDKDAVSSLTNSKGNCVNRAHLALALLRSAGIPARCASGLLYGNSYDVSYDMSGGTATTSIDWGDGSHVWIEVYYPNEGVWVPYDPFMDKGFVDTRHIRLTSSKDSSPTDSSTRGEAGLLFVKGASPAVKFDTHVSASGLQDSLSYDYQYTKQSPPHGTFMIARDMHSSTAPSLTPTPTVSPHPNNTTVTPLPNNSTVTPTVNPGISVTPTSNPPPTNVDYTKNNVTGTIVDASTGISVHGASVLLDNIQISASDAGKFAFLYAVTNGSYVLTVSAPGYMTEKQVLVPNHADLDVKVKLVPLSNTSSSPTPTAKPSPGPDILFAISALAGAGILIRRKKSP